MAHNIQFLIEHSPHANNYLLRGLHKIYVDMLKIQSMVFLVKTKEPKSLENYEFAQLEQCQNAVDDIKKNINYRIETFLLQAAEDVRNASGNNLSRSVF